MMTKILKISQLTLLFIFAGAPTIAQAGSLSQRFDNMGGNKALMKKAKAIDSQNRFRIVQKRAVDRDYRLEFSMSYGFNAGGDSYINTQNIGANIDFHINPKMELRR